MVKARKQIVKPVGPQKSDKKSTQNYNIWYNKYSGERHKTGEERTKASTRCNIVTDAGETRGTHRDDAGICLNFARGCCPLGFECSWVHGIPKGEISGTMSDCFGRERHENVRDDQSGVGSFMADSETSRTLYIGGIVRAPGIHTMVYEQFSEWGEVENVRVLDGKGVAFVRYKYRANAEFAMEAMQRQSLGHDEVLNVRWASTDPNPWAEKRKEANAKRKLVDAAVDAGILDPNLVDRDINLPSKRKSHPSVNEATGFYPNTDHFYQGTNGPMDTPLGQYHQQTSQPSPPKTLSDLVAWSQKQAATQSRSLEIASRDTKAVSPDTHTVQSLVCDYGSSSEGED